MKKVSKQEESLFHIKNDNLFPNTLKLYKGENEFPLDGIVGLTIDILPNEPATISIKYLLKDIDIKAEEKVEECSKDSK